MNSSTTSGRPCGASSLCACLYSFRRHSLEKRRDGGHRRQVPYDRSSLDIYDTLSTLIFESVHRIVLGIDDTVIEDRNDLVLTGAQDLKHLFDLLLLRVVSLCLHLSSSLCTFGTSFPEMQIGFRVGHRPSRAKFFDTR